MPDIKRLNLITFLGRYLSIFPESASLAQEVCRGEGKILLGAEMDGVPCGLLIADSQQDEKLLVEYLWVVENCRGIGIATALMNGCLELAPGRNLECHVTLVDEADIGFIQFLEKSGFEHYESSDTVVIGKNDTTVRQWEDFMAAKGSGLIRRLERKGFRVVSMAEAGKAVMSRLKENTDGRFPADMNPFSASYDILVDYSFIVLKGSEPLAYCIVVSADAGVTAIVQFLATASDYVGSGVFFMCLASSISAFARGEKCSRVAYTVFEKNAEMRKIQEKYLAFEGQQFWRQFLFRKNGQFLAGEKHCS